VNLLRIAFVSSGAKLGGEERYLSLVLDRLGDERVAGVIALEDGPYIAQLRSTGRPVDVLPTGRRLGIAVSALRLRSRLGAVSPDLVHANGVKAALTCALALPRGTPPFVWVKHDLSWDGRLAHGIAGRAAAVVGVSEAVLRTFQGRSRNRVHVIHNALPPLVVDARGARQTLLEALRPPAPESVIVIVGRLDPAKGHRELLGALPRLRESFPGLRLAIVGGAQPPFVGYEAELRAEAAEIGVADAVTFLGYRDDAVQLIAGADAVVIPTVVDSRGMGREGFSFVALEAMAVGTPVVGYAHGALPEILGDCGLLVPPGDRTALAAALADVLRGSPLRRQLTACARARVASEFSLPRMISSLQDVYRLAAKGAR
jgi:glycosyltransferase involved in cell wall biosynthesis